MGPLLTDILRRVDEPKEKIPIVLAIIAIFAFVHFNLYRHNPVHYKKTEPAEGLKFEDFLWFSLTLTLTVPFGDVYPVTPEAKTLSATQAILFWVVMLAGTSCTRSFSPGPASAS